MDKYEYQVCADQIKHLIDERRFAEAMNIADTIDWRKVRSVSMLCTVSEVYKINKKYEEARDILLLAYDRHPGGRSIVYALCELAIKLNDVLQAKGCLDSAQDDLARSIVAAHRVKGYSRHGSLLGVDGKDLAALVHAAVRAHVMRLLHAAAFGTCLHGGQNRLLQLAYTLALAHFRLLVLR